MERKAFTIPLTKNPSIKMNVIPGHFTTSQFHISHYLDLYDLKTNVLLARDVAMELALPYLTTTLVDTIVCMEGTEVIGAYMAEELLQEGLSVINTGREIHVLTPLSNVNRKLMFQSNIKDLIRNRNTILLVSSISSGNTINSALECLSYYGANVVGISALFNAYTETAEIEIHSMFTSEDIPGYTIDSPDKCAMCKDGHKLDALIIHDGYTKMQ
jgi:phosphoribosylpyrophosphate synthetase